MEREQNTEQSGNSGWQTRYIIGGTIVGGLIGLLAAMWLVRTSDERRGAPPEISTGDVLRTAVGIIGIVRGIASLGG